MVRKTRAAAASRGEMTLAQWADLDEDVEGELVDGVLEEEEVPTFLHEIVVGWLFALLHAWGTKRGAMVLGSEAKIAIRRRRGRKPDISLFFETKPALLDSIAMLPPRIVVEVISPRPRDARRDRIDKHGDYAGAGVRFYWLLDPQVRTLEILELDEHGRYAHVLRASNGRLKRVPGCPGLSINVDALWRTIDDAGEAPPKSVRRTPKKPRRR